MCPHGLLRGELYFILHFNPPPPENNETPPIVN
jgi:hypothetical protein